MWPDLSQTDTNWTETLLCKTWPIIDIDSLLSNFIFTFSPEYLQDHLWEPPQHHWELLARAQVEDNRNWNHFININLLTWMDNLRVLRRMLLSWYLRIALLMFAKADCCIPLLSKYLDWRMKTSCSDRPPSLE